MKQNLTMKAGINQGFFGYRQNWPDFFLSGNVFWGLGQGRSQGTRPPQIKILFQIFKLNFSWDMSKSKMHCFSNKFLKIAKRWVLSASSAS